MATRTDLRAFLKQRQKNSTDATSPSYLNSAAPTIEIPIRKECVNNDELVKYMSKLPVYLQGDETTLQSNVLNVGVLDWGRLEKWKHGRARGPDKCESKVSSTSALRSLHRCSKIDDHQVHDLRKVKASRDLQHGVRCTLEPELASSSSSSSRDSLRDHARVKNPGKSIRSRSSRELASSGLLSEMGNSGGSLGAKGSFMTRDMATEKRAGGELHAQEARERASGSGKQCVDKLDGEDKTVGGSNHQVSNIVLLRSRKSTLSGEPHMSSLDDNAKVAREVNRSLDLERDSEDMKLPLLGVDLSAKKKRFGGGTTRHSKTASRIFDQVIQEDESRHPSPSKRFSFSFGRLSRSFTFKEDSSAAQPLISSSDETIKSDSKQNTHCGSRVSPLRRLLDPLLKSKGSESGLPSKARSSSSNQDEKKQDAARTGALLQLTIRNGVPLFQFVVDDGNKSRSILGATMKSSDPSVKDDSVQYCTFYSVNEVKKKKAGSWLVVHGHKEKQHRFVYNVIGEMRLCNSDITTEQKWENTSSVIIREAVLVDETEQVKGRKEVAAVVIKKKPAEENGETTVIIPGGVHSIPEKGAMTPLMSRWRSGGCCDCGGWDVGCKLHVLSNKTFIHELDQSFQLFDQEEESEKNSGPVLEMTELKRGIYRVEYSSFLSHLQAFFVCVTVITSASEEEKVSKTTGKSSSPFAPPLSPVGRA